MRTPKFEEHPLADLLSAHLAARMNLQDVYQRQRAIAEDPAKSAEERAAAQTATAQLASVATRLDDAITEFQVRLVAGLQRPSPALATATVALNRELAEVPVDAKQAAVFVERVTLFLAGPVAKATGKASASRVLAAARSHALQAAMWKSVSTWRAAKSLLKLRGQADAAFPSRNKASDGIIGDAAHQTRDSDHNPWVKDGAMGVVTALDLTHDAANGCDAQLITEGLVASRDSRIKYIIWNRQIISSIVRPWVWRPYAGANPHTKHFHLSVSAVKTLYDDEREWDLGLPS